MTKNYIKLLKILDEDLSIRTTPYDIGYRDIDSQYDIRFNYVDMYKYITLYKQSIEKEFSSIYFYKVTNSYESDIKKFLKKLDNIDREIVIEMLIQETIDIKV